MRPRRSASSSSSRATFVVVTLAAVVGCFVLAITPGCSNQGEGERCDSLNGDDDCKTDEDLQCYPARLLNGTSSDRCCPRDRSLAKHPACVTPLNSIGVDVQTPADTGPATPADATITDTGQPQEASGDASDASDGG